MVGKLHVAFGTYIGISGGYMVLSKGLFNPEAISFAAAGCFICGSILGSELPDIDIPTSIIGKKTGFLSKIINRRFGHRGFIHSPCFLALLILMVLKMQLGGLYIPFFYGLFIGMTAHIFQDFFTKGGIPLFYPFIKKKYSIGFFKSGSIVDPVITFLLAFLWTLILFFIY